MGTNFQTEAEIAIRDYRKFREDTFVLLDTSIDLCEKYKLESEKSVFVDVRNNLENEKFSILLVGAFSSGKSMFINALLGKKYLPSSSNETTAVLCYIRHIDKAPEEYKQVLQGKDGFVVSFENGTEKTIEWTYENSLAYMTKDTHLEIKPKRIDLFVNSKYLENNVEIIDCPGLGGTDELGNKTEEMIKRANAAVFLFTAAQPGAKSDFAYLKKTQCFIDRIFFVLNKIDLIKKEEGDSPEKTVATLKNKILTEVGVKEIPKDFFGVSAENAIKSRTNDFQERDKCLFSSIEGMLAASQIEPFEARLWEFLTKGEKAKEQLLDPVSKVQKQIEMIDEACEEKIGFLEGKSDSQEIKDELIGIEQDKDKLQQTIEDKMQEIKAAVKNASDRLRAQLDDAKNSMESRIGNDINNWLYDTDDITLLPAKYERIAKRLAEDTQALIEEHCAEYQEQIGEIIYEFGYRGEISHDLFQNGISVKALEDYTFLKTVSEIDSKYEEEKARLERCKKELEGKIAAAGADASERIKAKAKRDKIEHQIDNNKKERQTYHSILGRPAAVKEERKKTEKVWRGGGLGWVATVLIGKKSVDRIDIIIDNSDQAAWDKNRADNISRTVELEEKLEQELKSLPNESPEEAQARLAKFESDKSEIDKQQHVAKEEYVAIIKRRNAQTINTAQENIKTYIRDVFSGIRKNLDEDVYSFSARKKISNMVAGYAMKINLAEMEKKRHRLNELNDELEKNAIERNKTLENCERQKKDTQALANRAKELHSQINSIKTIKLETENVEQL